MTQQLTTFHPRDAVTETAFVTAVTGTAGLTLAAVENALRKENIGARGVFTRSGGTIVSFGMVTMYLMDQTLMMRLIKCFQLLSAPPLHSQTLPAQTYVRNEIIGTRPLGGFLAAQRPA